MMRLSEVEHSKRKKVLLKYREHRELGRNIMEDISHHIPGGLLKAGKKLGITVGKTLVFKTENEPVILLDYALYNERSGGSFNAIERYLNINKTVKEKYSDFFEGINKSFYSVFEIVSKEPGFGVGLRDVMTNTNLLLIDVNLSNTIYLQRHLCGRVIPFTEGFYCTSGIFIPITHKWTEDAVHGIVEKFAEHSHSEQQPVFSKKQEAAFQSEVMRILLRADETEYLGFV